MKMDDVMTGCEITDLQRYNLLRAEEGYRRAGNTELADAIRRAIDDYAARKAMEQINREDGLHIDITMPTAAGSEWEINMCRRVGDVQHCWHWAGAADSTTRVGARDHIEEIAIRDMIDMAAHEAQQYIAAAVEIAHERGTTLIQAEQIIDAVRREQAARREAERAAEQRRQWQEEQQLRDEQMDAAIAEGAREVEAAEAAGTIKIDQTKYWAW